MSLRVAVAQQLDDGVGAGQEGHVDLGLRQLGLLGDQAPVEMVARNLAQTKVGAVELDRALEVTDGDADVMDLRGHAQTLSRQPSHAQLLLRQA
jgi:hypothetical protein